MGAPSSKSAQQLLDEVHRLAQVEAFDADGYLAQVQRELAESGADTREAIDQCVRESLGAIDRFAQQVMKVRLNHLLSDDASIPDQMRRYLATQILDYERDLPRLRGRVAEIAARVDPRGALATGAAVAEEADKVLALRARLRQGLLAMIPDEPPEEAPREEREVDRFELLELD
jgi:hypothetical protein